MLDLNDRSSPEAQLETPRPLTGRSIATVLLLVAQLALVLLLLASHAQRLVLLARVAAHAPVTRSELVQSDVLIGGLSLLFLLSALTTAVAFTLWLHRAYWNLRAFRPGPFDFTPGEAAASFYIPFLNLVRPYQAMRDVWQASDPAVPPPTAVRPGGADALVVLWWAFFLGRNVPAFWMTAASGVGIARLEALRSVTRAALAMYALNVPAACLAAALVVLVERRQDALRKALDARGVPEAASTAVAPV